MRSAAAVAVAFAVLALGPSSTASSRRPCQMTGSKTIASSPGARVFQRSQGFPNSGSTYGCLYSADRRVLLGGYIKKPGNTVQQYDVRLAGRYVAFGESRLGKEFIGFYVRVFDLRRGKPFSLSETGRPTRRAVDESFGNAWGIGPTVSVRLRGTGQVAWIARAQYADAVPQYEVRKREGPKTTKLASGGEIDPESLALEGNRLSWRHGDQRAHSTLGPDPRPPG